MKRIIMLCLLSVIVMTFGCSTDADLASDNLSKAAEMFQIDRRVVFYNGINGEYILSIEGRCSIEDYGTKLTVTCKTGENQFLKHYLGRSDNVTYFAEQLETAAVSTYRYKVIFKPSVIVPDVDLSTKG